MNDITQLKRYGKNLEMTPKTLLLKINWLFIKGVVREIGLWASLRIIPSVLFYTQLLTYKKGKGVVIGQKEFSKDDAKKMTILFSLLHVLTQKYGKNKAYDLVKKLTQDSSAIIMCYVYQVKELSKFSDPYKAFCEFHKAMFHQDHRYQVRRFVEEEHCLTMIVNRCANCQVAQAFQKPELATLGCDSDLVSYPIVMDQIGGEFVREKTLAKGGAFCEFKFYRKGHAPKSYKNV
ncbi:L-2-amino-thiazoline-4-carboxylic acid hydrolase [Candidatus Uabimicrobium sp. HlEnr_7]|uniref:L-2-amino-thiazoline-4-carboxylic acid hydrolase n=1 Tax=Candidatus Uabimicrobium helgolandensis TaxID=3095367 RepID=UPI0035579A1B